MTILKTKNVNTCFENKKNKENHIRFAEIISIGH